MPFANDCVQQGYRSLRDIKSVEADQNTAGSVDFTMRNPQTGEPIDLTEYGIEESSSSLGVFNGVKVIMQETPQDTSYWNEIEAEVKTAAQGVITIPYTYNDMRRAGIFTSQAEIWEDGDLRRVIPFFFVINPSLTNDSADLGLTLSIAEIRMTLRDTDPEGNFLLEELDFTRSEIALCIRRCIDYWNEALPPVTTYKATNFPWRYHLSKGVAALLHQMAANHKMRNDLPYAAGGVTVQDTIKFKQYLDFYKEYWTEWIDWVRDRKLQINISGGFQILGSGYGQGAIYR